MPYSIFFDGGYAIHGSYEISHLGSPASHGCIRLHPDNAAVLFKLVKANMKDTQIVVTGAGAEPATRARGATRRPQPSFESIFTGAPAKSADRARWRWENMQ
jgi:hypothetical protein